MQTLVYLPEPDLSRFMQSAALVQLATAPIQLDTSSRVIWPDTDVGAVVVPAAAMTPEFVHDCDQHGAVIVALTTSDSDRDVANRLSVQTCSDVETACEAAARACGIELGIRRETGNPPDPRNTTIAATSLPVVVGVFGAHGSPGATTVTLGIAEALARAGRRILLIDADVRSPAITARIAASSSSAGVAAATLLATRNALTAAELERLSVAGPFGVRVLGGIVTDESSMEPNADGVENVIDIARTGYDTVLIDLGSHGDPLPLAALKKCTHLFGVGAADAVSLGRYVHAHAQWTPLAPVAPRVLINRLRSSTLGVDAASQVARLLREFVGVTDAHTLPDDTKLMDRHLLSGEPVTLLGQRSPLVREFERIATELEQCTPTPTMET